MGSRACKVSSWNTQSLVGLGHVGSYLVSQPGIEPTVPCITEQILNHLTTREVPSFTFESTMSCFTSLATRPWLSWESCQLSNILQPCLMKNDYLSYDMYDTTSYDTTDCFHVAQNSNHNKKVQVKILVSGQVADFIVSYKQCQTLFWGLQNHCRWWLQPWN